MAHMTSSPALYGERTVVRLTVNRFTTSDALRSLADWIDNHPSQSIQGPIEVGHHTLGSMVMVNIT